jgi:hypothetical protein
MQWHVDNYVDPDVVVVPETADERFLRRAEYAWTEYGIDVYEVDRPLAAAAAASCALAAADCASRAAARVAWHAEVLRADGRFTLMTYDGFEQLQVDAAARAAARACAAALAAGGLPCHPCGGIGHPLADLDDDDVPDLDGDDVPDLSGDPEPCEGCARAASSTELDVQAQLELGMVAKPPHGHCHHCDSVARVDGEAECAVCGETVATVHGGIVVRAAFRRAAGLPLFLLTLFACVSPTHAFQVLVDFGTLLPSALRVSHTFMGYDFVFSSDAFSVHAA